MTSSTISKLSSLELSEQCVQQLTGNFHCFRCSHHELDWKPCASLCHRTIDTCVGSSVLATLDDTWATLTSVFEKLTKTKEDFHMDSIFNTYHELISNAKQSLESNNPHISKKVRSLTAHKLVWRSWLGCLIEMGELFSFRLNEKTQMCASRSELCSGKWLWLHWKREREREREESAWVGRSVRMECRNLIERGRVVGADKGHV